MAYAPAGNLSTSADLAHLIPVYYDRVALTPLRKVFMFWNLVDNRSLPKRNGKTVQFFRYSQLGANTTATQEGTGPGQSLTMTSTTLQATVSQYSDFISFSDLLVDTAPDNDIIAVGADQLGYRAGLTCDTIIRNELDGVAASIDVSALGDYASGADLANIRHRMAGLDIMGMNGGDTFPTVMHPYVTYDLIHDPQVGGFMDVNKQPGAAGHSKLQSVQGRGLLLRFNNCEVYESTNVTVTSGSPNTYRAYFAGQEGIAAIDLAGRGPTRSKDQNKTKFSINVIREERPSLANPEGKIRGMVSYNFVWVTKILDTNPYRVRKIDFASSLGL